MKTLKPRQRTIALLMIIGCACLLEACHSSSSSSSNTLPAGGTTESSPRAQTSVVPMPALAGPIEGGVRGGPWGGIVEELAPLEPTYMQEEYFFSGTAEGRGRDAELDGTTADYTSRILVFRPKNQEDFNGTVLVEWVNVTAEMEMEVIWAQAYAHAQREGYAYVAVSVQEVGVQASPLALKYWDPVRYEPLNHPGDAYAYDILGQAVRALFAQGDIRPMGDLNIERIIGSGESQSAAYLIPYINKVDAQHQLFDAYLVHTYPGVIQPGVPVPVLMILTDTEVEGITSPIGEASQSPEEFGQIFSNVPGASVLAIPLPETAPADFDRFRVWEVAGGSHYDKQALVYISARSGRDMTGFATYDGLPLGCAEAGALYPTVIPQEYLGQGLINQLGMQRPVRAALDALNHWIITGEAPAIQPRMNRNEDGSILRDEDGLATGGIRMPVMDVPLGMNEGQSCVFFGRYEQFADAAERYASLEDFLAQFSAAAEDAVARGVLLPEEAQAYIDEARQEAEDSALWP